MGAWGFGPFENDDACDWAGEFLRQSDSGGLLAIFGRGKIQYISKTFRWDIQDFCMMKIAAAEVVAALSKRPCPSLSTHPDSYTEDLHRWLISTKLAIPNHLAALARVQVEHVLAHCGMSDPHSKKLTSEDMKFQSHWTDLLKRLSQ